MDGSSQASVTPQGVRDGDPAVLAALVARRGPAVLAFCDAVCEPEVVSQAVAEAFARFRALVATVGDVGDADPDGFLLGATRHAAASMARAPSDTRGLFRVLGRGASPETYAAVPGLLAARADSMLGSEDLERLSRLLEKSAAAREVEAAFRRAERGYRSPPARPIGTERTVLIIDAMQAAAPIAEPFASQLAAAAAEAAAAAPVAIPVPDEDPTALINAEPATRAPEPASPNGSWEAAQPDEDAAAWPEAEPANGATALHAVVPTELGVSAAAPVDEEDRDGDRELPAQPADDEDPFRVIVPAGDPALAELEMGGDVPVESATRVYRVRRGLPRLSLPDGGGLSLPRRGDDVEALDLGPGPDHGPVYRLLLPAVAILIAVLVMLAIAGVFGGGEPAPAAVLTPAVATQLPPDGAAPAPAVRTATTTTPAAKRKGSGRKGSDRRAPSGTSAATTSTPVRTVADEPPPSAATAAPQTTTSTRSVGTTARPAAVEPPASSPASSDQGDGDYQPYDPSRQPVYP